MFQITKAPLSALLIWAAMALQAQLVQAIPIGGVDFPDGATSFADSVFTYTKGTNVGTN